jgi:N-acetylneuraminic acid mutarotase
MIMSPIPINLHAMTATLGPDGKIYVFGGTNSKLFETDAVEVYDPVTDHWAPGTPMPYGQECACATFTSGPDGEVVVLGGWGDPRKIELDSVVAYNPRTDRWRFLAPLPAATSAGGAATVESETGNTHIYVIGGTPHFKRVQEYSFQ